MLGGSCKPASEKMTHWLVAFNSFLPGVTKDVRFMTYGIVPFP